MRFNLQAPDEAFQGEPCEEQAFAVELTALSRNANRLTIIMELCVLGPR